MREKDPRIYKMFATKKYFWDNFEFCRRRPQHKKGVSNPLVIVALLRLFAVAAVVFIVLLDAFVAFAIAVVHVVAVLLELFVAERVTLPVALVVSIVFFAIVLDGVVDGLAAVAFFGHLVLVALLVALSVHGLLVAAAILVGDGALGGVMGALVSSNGVVGSGDDGGCGGCGAAVEGKNDRELEHFSRCCVRG